MGCSSLQSIWHLPNLIIQYTGADHSFNYLTNRATVTFIDIHSKVLLYLQFTVSVVNILDGISDWPEEVVQERSSEYVYNSHSKLCTTACELGVLFIFLGRLYTQTW